MPDFETTPVSIREKLAKMRLRFSSIKTGQRVCIYAREDNPFDSKQRSTEREGQPTPSIDEPRSLPVAPMKKIHEGKVTRKSDAYFSVGGVTVLKKDMENGAVVVRLTENPLVDTRAQSPKR